MAIERLFTTKRQSIVNALVDKIKQIDGTGEFLSNLNGNVSPRIKFWDEISEFPAVHINSGAETRDYQGAGFKDRYLSVVIRCYVQEEDSVIALDKLLEDIETVVEENSRLEYYDKLGNLQATQQISVVSIDTDEGVLDPIGVGEMLLEVRY